MNVELVYGTAAHQRIYSLSFTSSVSVEEVIRQSGVLDDFPEIDLTCQKVGIYAEIVSLDHQVKAGDRVEIYRPLSIDPKEARRLRAERKRKKEGIRLFGA
ncbi:RnfH family protein [Fangia hongkongensis]|uniref:RnfH family protein n=1 Tax=Fangia hongkongensis TaxID=270495 RepID=UPI0003729B13|nr:RnfH family protein [Fangia hongkongensis]MBK2124295.1 RnfH family protein [Fangia hongkongensis]